MAAVRDLSTSDAVFKSMINNMVEDFSCVECLCEEQKVCLKNMAKAKMFLQSFPPVLERVKSFNSFHE